MDSIKKANLLVIFTIAIIGFGISNVIASLTGEYVNLEMPEINNENQKLLAVGDENFSPIHINKVIIKNDTNNTTTDNNPPVNNTNTVNNSSNDLFDVNLLKELNSNNL